MHRASPWILLLAIANRAPAQVWQSGPSVELIQRAAAHRAGRDTDSLLAGWRADAHGFLRYTSVFDHGNGPSERVIRADELLVEVYGEAPSRSKQIIRAWRDTSFLPNRMTYHRDHLGIVASDFGNTIRLGQGEEVRDIPHPLSPAGIAAYQFAVGDTTVIDRPGGRIRVVAVDVRPSSPDSAATVGTLYLDIDRAALVRFRFTFTPASYRDRTVKDITVTLENSLQQNARWLPWRQSIVIRRALPLLDFPVITVIRADWTLDNYTLGVLHPPGWFDGAYISGLVRPDTLGPWPAPLAATLSILPATDADVADAARSASRALGGRLLDGLPRLRLRGAGVSDLLHINRVQGVTPAIGGTIAVGSALRVVAGAGIGLSDHRAIGEVGVGHETGGFRWTVSGSRRVVDIADTPATSGIANSITTILGSDQGDYVLLERATARLDWTGRQMRLAISAGRERSTSVVAHFEPLSGTIRANPALGAGSATIVRGSLTTGEPATTQWQLAVEAGAGSSHWGRAHGMVEHRIALPSGDLQMTIEGGIATAGLPLYRDFVLGGQGTLLGVPFREIGGTRMARADVWWQLPVHLPTPPVPYSRYVQLISTFGPFVAAGVAGGDQPLAPWRGTGEVLPVAGLRLDLWGPLLRLELAAALRTGRIAFAIDVHPDWWGVM